MQVGAAVVAPVGARVVGTMVATALLLERVKLDWATAMAEKATIAARDSFMVKGLSECGLFGGGRFSFNEP